MTQLFPYNENGADYGPSGVCRGAMMGRGGADPRAVWPHGILTQEEAETRLADALAFAGRCPGSYADDKVTEARAVLNAILTPYAGRLTLRRVPMSPDGYDPGGAYWGGGDPLFCAWSPCRSVVSFFRAGDYRQAAAALRTDYPAATIKAPVTVH